MTPRDHWIRDSIPKWQAVLASSTGDRAVYARWMLEKVLK